MEMKSREMREFGMKEEEEEEGARDGRHSKAPN
jgi:hypothetical protein